jgi:predicted DsbA family dithiol-disulfide isomerase
MKKKVIVYSDYICPFCYIGKHRADKLQEEFDVDVEWRPLEIHPETPKGGVTLKELGLDSHYLDMIIENVNRLASEIGLNLVQPKKIPNSKLALMLCEFARENGKFNEYHTEVFKAYWEDQMDIGDPDTLFDIIDGLGLDPDQAEKFLKKEIVKEKIERYLLEAKAWGIDSVPTFIIGNIKIEGAQPYELMKKAIRNAKW